MLVKDIYGHGSDYTSLGLPSDLIASSFGKAIIQEGGESDDEQGIGSFNDEDVARLESVITLRRKAYVYDRFIAGVCYT